VLRITLVLVGFAMVASHGAGGAAPSPAPADSARMAFPDSSVAESLGVAPARSVTPPADTLATPARTDTLAPARPDTLAVIPAADTTITPAQGDTLGPADAFPPADSLAALRHPAWALALAGGVARGLAYAGTFRVLDEERIRPRLVAGSSMGALMAALYAAGYPDTTIVRLCEAVDWSLALSPSAAERREWRDWRIPGPWVKLDDRTGKLGMLPGLLNDAAINHMLASQMLECDALARGDFDRLGVPLRVVATDLNTMTAVSIRDGSIAQAVRVSIGLPVVFPAMVRDGQTLGDGGFSSNLPILAAREPGIDHVLAVDVALPQPRLDAESPAALVGITLLDKLNKRGQFDTLAVGDRYVWIKMPGISAYDFGAIDSMATLGAEDTRAQLAGWPDSLGLERGLERVGPPDPVLPPLAGPPRFVHEDGTETRLTSAARHVMGRMPAGPFRPGELRPGLEKLYQAGLFTSAWPRFEGGADSTRLVFQVADEARREARFTAAADNDRGARAQGSLSWRPTPFGSPSVATIAGTIRSFDWNLFGSLEPHRLDRGSPGWFLRGGVRRVMTRVFDAAESWTREYNNQSEAMIGSQLPRYRGMSVQAGIGYGAYKEAGVTSRGVLGSVELTAPRGLLESAHWTGMNGPGRFSAFTVDAHMPIVRGMWTLSPGFHGGWASSGTPFMELPAIGGPTRLGGYREDEWSGRTALAGELRLILAPSPFFELHAAAQLAGVREPVSRADLSGRVVGAFTTGLRISTPFGPLALDYGIADSEQHRVDVRFGTWF
jgi:predicted acylesterase/phospholipase RssA